MSSIREQKMAKSMRIGYLDRYSYARIFQSKLWLAVFIVGLIIHMGTAILRLGSFFPPTQLTDFTAYYVGASLIHQGLSPYPWPSHYVNEFSKFWGLSYTPGAVPSTPLWLVSMVPFSLISLPYSVTLWIALNFIILVYCHKSLLNMSGIKNNKILLLTFPLILTFGPSFLNFTIGQCGLLILLASVLIIEDLNNKSHSIRIVSLSFWVLAIAAKIYPVIWIVSQFITRCKRNIVIMILSLCSSGLFFIIFYSEITKEYILNFLPAQALHYSSDINTLDDLSVYGFARRLFSSGKVDFPTLSVHRIAQVNWHWPWNMPRIVILMIAIVFLLAVAAFIVRRVLQSDSPNHIAVFIIVILFSVIVLPHMERYNQTLVIPALVWLWNSGNLQRQQTAILVYLLFGFSRLTHLWALFLPANIAILFSGIGVFAVLLLIYSVSAEINHMNPKKTCPFSALSQGAP